MSDGFPTGLRPDGEAGAPTAEALPSGARRWVVELAVVPSVVSFRAHPDLAWHPRIPFLLDLMVGAVLLTVGAYGWRHLRRLAE